MVDQRRRPLRFALIGTGRIGQAHAANIAANSGAELTRVADPDLERANNLAERFGGEATDSAERVIASGDIDAVLVASPTDTHVHLIKACLDARLPVLCEKPIDLDIDMVDSLRERVAASDVPVAIGFNQRFDPAFARARASVVAGEIGLLEYLSIDSRDPGPPPADYIAGSGGIFRDMTIHDFDMARTFLGDIVEVQAFGAQLFDPGAREHGDFDSVVVTLRAASGAIATITNSRHSAIGYDQRLEAVGTQGMVQVHNVLSSAVSVSTATAVEAKPPYVERFLERYAASYALELEEFMSLVHGEPSESPTFEDGRAALIIADAAQSAATSGVAVPLG